MPVLPRNTTEPKTIERHIRSTGAPGAALLARLPASHIDKLFRETADAPCPSPLIDARLKALGVSKLGHRLQIQAALKEARDAVRATVPPSPIAFADLTNSAANGGRTPKLRTPAAKMATPKIVEEPEPEEADEDDEADECVLEDNFSPVPQPFPSPTVAAMLEDVEEEDDHTAYRGGEPKPHDGATYALAVRLLRLPVVLGAIYLSFYKDVGRTCLRAGLRLAEPLGSRLPGGGIMLAHLRAYTGIYA